MSTRLKSDKRDKETKTINLAETITENPATFTIIDKILEHPKVQKTIDKLLFKKTLKYGWVMACLFTGMFSIVNGLILGLNLGWFGWVGSGIIASLIGGFFTFRQLRKDAGKPRKGTAESSEPS